MKIAFLGASSYIAKDLILSFSDNDRVNLDLFGRRPEEIAHWLKINALDNQHNALDYTAFNHLTSYDAIINFVGVGNPTQAIQMGSAIFDITCRYDQLALAYLQYYPDTKYIFLSSGAVYGNNFIEPVHSDTVASIDLNDTLANDWYSKAKLYTEIGHRSRSEFNIVDLRVFNYFSSTIDLSTRYFISDVLRSICNRDILYTSSDNIYRDYLDATDLYQLVKCVLATERINMALDCYSKAPIDKISILEQMKEKFGLRYSAISSAEAINTLNFKLNYYSLNKRASSIGYLPNKTSLDCLVHESEKLLYKVDLK